MLFYHVQNTMPYLHISGQNSQTIVNLLIILPSSSTNHFLVEIRYNKSNPKHQCFDAFSTITSKIPTSFFFWGYIPQKKPRARTQKQMEVKKMFVPFQGEKISGSFAVSFRASPACLLISYSSWTTNNEFAPETTGARHQKGNSSSIFFFQEVLSY